MLTGGWSAWTFGLALAGACATAVVVSVVMSWASNRSALWNMVFGAFLVSAVLAAAVLLAYLLTSAAFG